MGLATKSGEEPDAPCAPPLYVGDQVERDAPRPRTRPIHRTDHVPALVGSGHRLLRHVERVVAIVQHGQSERENRPELETHEVVERPGRPVDPHALLPDHTLTHARLPPAVAAIALERQEQLPSTVATRPEQADQVRSTARQYDRDMADTTTTAQLDLAGDFAPATQEQWLDGVRKVILKSKPDATEAEFADAFARQLVHRTEDGLQIEPLYTADDGPSDPGLPGFAPFVRSAHAAPVPWEIRQRVWTAAEGSSAVGELESGATGVLLEVPSAVDALALETMLDGVFLDLAPISLDGPTDSDGVDAARLMLLLWDHRQVEPDARAGTLGVDPLGAWVRTGGSTAMAAGFTAAAQLVSEAAVSAPKVRVMVADGTVWHDAGATVAQELAWTIAGAAHAVRALIADGVAVEVAFATFEFRWAATADQFSTIAKLRAARRVWARVGELAGIEPSERAMYQHAEGSRPMMARYDPWVNALRSTVACFGAAMGGADAVTTLPHDLLRTPGGSRLGRRIARNTQNVLQSESNLSRVVDPAGGSWYVENLTEQLAQAAWSLIHPIEADGGIDRALLDGTVQAALDDACAQRARQLATRRRPLTGVTEFPDIGEPPPPPLPDGNDAATVETAFEPLVLHRLADDFEEQRGRADAHAVVTGDRPTVFLATLGSPAAFTARMTFAKNLFEVAGIATVAGPPSEFTADGSTVVCLCSSDGVYREQGEDAATELRATGATRVYLAGRGLDLAGVDEEVGMGSDVLAVLSGVLDELGVDR